MAVSEDHASCWVHKDLTVTTKQIEALLMAARASGGKDKCQVRLTGIEREYWMGTEIGRLEGYGFRTQRGRIQLEPSGDWWSLSWHYAAPL